MLQILLSLVALILCVVSLGVLFKTCFTKSWFFSWLKGTLGLIFLGIVVGAAFLMLDLWSYKQALKERAIAEVSIEQLKARYAIFLSARGLVAKPINKDAEGAVGRVW